VLQRVETELNGPSPLSRILGIFKGPSTYEQLTRNSIKHFFGIDILRGLSAVAILIWHYQHFYIGGVAGFEGQQSFFDKSMQPLYQWLIPFYEHGFWAVQMFWAISGFVFCHAYACKKTTATDFAVARFARLYPLHFITLVVITCIQSLSFRVVGHYQIVASNDPFGFVQQLMFVSAWGFPHGNNFNGPIWSVSIEMAIYAAFFLTARRIYTFGILVPATISYVCLLIVDQTGPINNFLLCGFFFFLGGSIYLWLLKFHRNPLAILAPATAGLGYFVYLIVTNEYATMRFYHVATFLIAPSVLLVGWLDYSPKIEASIASWKWFGDTTYSTYLWHFPIQVSVLLIFTYLHLDQHFFNHPAVLIAWVGAMVAIARISFLKIEFPLQKLCLKHFRKSAHQR